MPNVFPAVDPASLRLALVGESPGADECALGFPFAGKSGWWLNQWLAQAGLSRFSCFVGNVCQCRPGPNSNEFDLLEWNGPEVQAGIAALQRDLERFRPNCIVALGNAAFHLLRHGNTAPPKSAKLGLFQWPSRIGTWRGSLFEAARSFDALEAADLRVRGGRRAQLYNLRGEPVTTPAKGQTAVHEVYEATRLEPAPCISQSKSLTLPVTFTPQPLPHAASLQPPPREGESLLAAAVSPGVVESERASLASAGLSLLNLVGAVKPSGVLEAPVVLEERAPGLHQPSLPPAWKCLCTYHPASTFREPSFTYPLVSDLKRAVAEAASPTLNLPVRDIAWNLSAAQIEERCAAIRVAKQPIAHDIEGGLGGLQCLSFAESPNRAFVVDCMERDFDYTRKMAAVIGVLEDPHVPKVLWNAMYERAVWSAVASVTLRNYEDGMLAWWERFSELPKGLDFVASILTREPYWAEGIGWDKRTGAPKITGAPFYLYNGIDSCVTLEIWQHPILRAVTESRTPVPFAT